MNYFLCYRSLFVACLASFTAQAQPVRVYDACSVFAKGGFARVQQGERYFYVDTAGKYAFEGFAELTEGYTLVHPLVPGSPGRLPGNSILVHKAGKLGVLSASGEWILPPEYDKIDRTSRGDRWQVVKNGKSSCGKPRISRFQHGLATMYRNGKCGVINTRGEVVVPASWEGALIDYTGRFIVVWQDEKYGILDRTGNMLLSAEYDMLKSFQTDYGEEHPGLYYPFTARKNNEWHFFLSSGRLLFKTTELIEFIDPEN